MTGGATLPHVGVVVIGRNEGVRFERCIRSLSGWMPGVVYVDSGSTDGSIEKARSAGAIVVELDLAVPFTAARARNAGVEALQGIGNFAYVQFVDGDCEMDPDWIPVARRYLEEHPGVVAVGGRLRERHPEKSVYNRLCAIEWNTPVGEVESRGGIALFRMADFIAAGRFDPTLIAGEEPELCHRLRERGGRIMRLPDDMAVHDADILAFRQYWRRMRRAGYGSLDVVTRLAKQHSGKRLPFAPMVHSVYTWTLRWCALTLVLAMAGCWLLPNGGLWLGALAGVALWFAQAVRISWGVRRRAPNGAAAMAYGFFALVGKWAQLAGHRAYRADVRAGRAGRIIEYKHPGVRP